MIFTEQDLINAFKANVDNKGWIYLVGNPESKAKFLIDYMKQHQEPIDEDKLDKLAKESKQFVISLASDANLISSFSLTQKVFISK